MCFERVVAGSRRKATMTSHSAIDSAIRIEAASWRCVSGTLFPSPHAPFKATCVAWTCSTATVGWSTLLPLVVRLGSSSERYGTPLIMVCRNL